MRDMRFRDVCDSEGRGRRGEEREKGKEHVIQWHFPSCPLFERLCYVLSLFLAGIIVSFNVSCLPLVSSLSFNSSSIISLLLLDQTRFPLLLLSSAVSHQLLSVTMTLIPDHENCLPLLRCRL